MRSYTRYKRANNNDDNNNERKKKEEQKKENTGNVLTFVGNKEMNE